MQGCCDKVVPSKEALLTGSTSKGVRGAMAPGEEWDPCPPHTKLSWGMSHHDGCTSEGHRGPLQGGPTTAYFPGPVGTHQY